MLVLQANYQLCRCWCCSRTTSCVGVDVAVELQSCFGFAVEIRVVSVLVLQSNYQLCWCQCCSGTTSCFGFAVELPVVSKLVIQWN
jgi:hypothetical protein